MAPTISNKLYKAGILRGEMIEKCIPRWKKIKQKSTVVKVDTVEDATWNIVIEQQYLTKIRREGKCYCGMHMTTVNELAMTSWWQTNVPYYFQQTSGSEHFQLRNIQYCFAHLAGKLRLPEVMLWIWIVIIIGDDSKYETE